MSQSSNIRSSHHLLCKFCRLPIILRRQSNRRYLPFNEDNTKHACLKEIDDLIYDIGVRVTSNSAIAEHIANGGSIK